MNEPKVYIVIVNYQKWEDAAECIESIFRSTYRHFSIVLIDNNSRNKSIEKIISFLEKKDIASLNYCTARKEEVEQSLAITSFPRITFIQNDTNAGFARANNMVLQFLKNKEAYTWLLNPDMVIEENALGEMVSFMSQQPATCIAGSVVKSYSGNRELLFYGGGRVNFISGTVQMIRSKDQKGDIDYISGASLFTYAGNFKTAGLLPDNYFLYWEETDWCYQAKLDGFILTVCMTAVCYDKVSSVIGRGFQSDYYYARNGLLFISKFRKQNIPIVTCLMILRYLKRVATGNFSRAKGIRHGMMDFFKGKNHEAE